MVKTGGLDLMKERMFVLAGALLMLVLLRKAHVELLMKDCFPECGVGKGLCCWSLESRVVVVKRIRTVGCAERRKSG